MSLHLPQVAVVADVIANPVLVDVGVLLTFATLLFRQFKSFKDGTGILFPTTRVVDLRRGGFWKNWYMNGATSSE